MMACMEAYRFPVLSLLAQLVAQSGPRSVGKRLPVICKCFHRTTTTRTTTATTTTATTTTARTTIPVRLPKSSYIGSLPLNFL